MHREREGQRLRYSISCSNSSIDCSVLNFSGEKQAATHVSLDQEYDVDLAAMWHRLEEQLVAAANRGVIPVNFQPTQYCLNSQTQNLRQPLAVMEGKMTSVGTLELYWLHQD